MGRPGEIGVNVLLNHLPRTGNLEEAGEPALVDRRIAVRKWLRVREKGTGYFSSLCVIKKVACPLFCYVPRT